MQLAHVMLQASADNLQLTAKYDLWQLGILVRHGFLCLHMFFCSTLYGVP